MTPAARLLSSSTCIIVRGIKRLVSKLPTAMNHLIAPQVIQFWEDKVMPCCSVTTLRNQLSSQMCCSTSFKLPWGQRHTPCDIPCYVQAKAYGPGVSGALFGAGWWFWVDACASSDVKVPFVQVNNVAMPLVVLVDTQCCNESGDMCYSICLAWSRHWRSS